jgi:Ca-activated chloride channel family protein
VETAKNVIFALDKSGSMNGQKFTQARAALRFILERLEPQDNFNLVDYNNQVFTWKPELMDMSPENRRSALAYVDNLRSGGSTNIEEALTTSFKMIGDPDQANYIIFLTDGQPTVGEQNEMRLAELARKANPRDGARLFSFGVGYDVNARLLDRLSGQAGGSSVFVSPDENLETKVSSLFSRLTSPVLVRPKLASSRPINRTLPDQLPDLFAGQQMAVVGRYPAGGPNTFTLTGLSGDKTEKFQYPVHLATGPVPDGPFIAGLWAQRRIGEIIDQLDLAGGRPNPELVDELVQLSKKYGILTPYTSFLALEKQNITRNESLAPLVAENLSIMGETAGRQANVQREFKNEMRAASPAAPAQMRTRAAPAPTASEMRMAGLDSQVARAGSAKLNPPNQWGGQTFFFKDGQWQAENLTEADLKNITTVQQFSEEYFTLAKKLKPEEMIWLTQKEPVLFKYEGRNYLIEPASEAEAG